jgi:hypothetical protein
LIALDPFGYLSLLLVIVPVRVASHSTLTAGTFLVALAPFLARTFSLFTEAIGYSHDFEGSERSQPYIHIRNIFGIDIFTYITSIGLADSFFSQ